MAKGKRTRTVRQDDDADSGDDSTKDSEEEDAFSDTDRRTSPRNAKSSQKKAQVKKKHRGPPKAKAKGGPSKASAAPEVLDITDEIDWLKIGDHANQVANVTKACLWPGFVDQANAEGKLKPMNQDQMGRAVLNNFLMLNKYGKVGKHNASYVAELVIWDQTKKQGGGTDTKSKSRGWVALKGYNKFVGYCYTRLKYLIHRAMDYNLSDLNLSHWEKLLTDDGVQCVVDLLPAKPDVWKTALDKAGGSMTMPTTEQLQEASKEEHGNYSEHHSFVLFLVPPRGNPTFAKINLRLAPELWAKVALITLLCNRGKGNDEDIGIILQELEDGDYVYSAFPVFAFTY